MNLHHQWATVAFSDELYETAHAEGYWDEVDGRDAFNERMSEIVARFDEDAATDGGRLWVWRALSLTDDAADQLLDDIRQHRAQLGEYWSFDEESAAPYNGLQGDLYHDFLVGGLVDAAAIDWQSSLLANLSEPHECEITVKDGADVEVHRVYLDNEVLLDHDGFSGEVDEGGPWRAVAQHRIAAAYYDASGMTPAEVLLRWVENGDKAYDGPYMVDVDELWPIREYTWSRRHHRAGAVPVPNKPYGTEFEQRPGHYLGSPDDPSATTNRWDELVEYMRANGWSTKDPAHVMVGKNGVMKVGEGNHRLGIARQLGIQQVPVQYHFQQDVLYNQMSDNPNAVKTDPRPKPRVIEYTDELRAPVDRLRVSSAAC